MLYTDGVHLIADSILQLLKYCDSIGHHSCWFHNHWRHPHYDLVNKQGGAIVNKKGVNILEKVMGDPTVKQVSSRTIVDICRVRFCFPQNEREKKEWEEHHWEESLEVEIEAKVGVRVVIETETKEVVPEVPLEGVLEESFELEGLIKVKRK